MKILVLAPVMIFLLLGSGLAWGALPTFIDGGKIQDGAGDLNLESLSMPTCVDWNNDGAIDMLVGEAENGHLWLFLNQGSNTNPNFNGGSKITSSGTPITFQYG